TFFALMLLPFLWSCGGEENKTEKQEAADASAEEMTTLEQETYEETVACMKDPYHICESGIQSANLNDYIADIMVEPLDVQSVGDSLDEGNGYVWLVRTLHMDEGQVLVEGNFIDDRKATEETLNQSQINRIRIESEQFYTEEGIKVGQTLSDLLKVYTDSAFYIVSQPDYGVLDLSRFNSRIHYLIEIDVDLMEGLESAAAPLSEVPGSQAIRSIVIM
ncbi:MAG: hypothetical protein AAFR59_06295, partial [Bacteroidota bacterium]